MEYLLYIAVAVAAYLCGSVPTGYLVAKARGIDIRSVGSGNIGATNVFRILGKKAGTFVLLVDAFKGFASCAWVPLLLAHLLGQTNLTAEKIEWLHIIGGMCSVLGHNYTCWLNFKGGKGIATSAGVILALFPKAFIIAFGLWVIVTAVTRYISLASIVAAFVLPFATWMSGQSTKLIVLATIMGALAIYKHKANIKRLMNGTESRIGSRKPTGAPTGVRP